MEIEAVELQIYWSKQQQSEMQSNEDKKFKPENKPFKENKISSSYRVVDEKDSKFFAKFFLEKKLVELNIFESIEYNQTVLSDLSDQMFPEHFMEIKYTYSIPEGFIFVTDPYEINLEAYLKNKVVEEQEAMKIFEQIIKAIYSLYMAGFWHRNIRPEHFVKAGDTWKLESMVYNENYKEANGVDCEYLWNPAYQPPEAYETEEFTEEELDEMVVWNLGSLLLDMLLSHHKLKDKSLLDKFRGRPFSFKALGVKKVFSREMNELLEKMLHYNRKERMTIAQMFSNEFISREVARLTNSGGVRKERIYIAGHSNLSKKLQVSSDRSQEILNISDFKSDKEKMEQNYSNKISKKNDTKIESDKQFLNKIKGLNKDGLQTIAQFSVEESQISRRSDNNFRMEAFASNPRYAKAIQAYKCYYDKCELLTIASKKIEESKDLILTNEQTMLNKYAVNFASLMFLHRLAESMNRNLNYLDLEPELWSDFQESNEFKGLKEIVNYRRQERKYLLNPLREQYDNLSEHEKSLTKFGEIEDFVHCNYKLTKFEHIKIAYRKILKQTYDAITLTYNQNKTQDLAKIGMYVTYCLTIDKLYIPADIPDNFVSYFEWFSLPVSSYVPMDKFQDYLENADNVTLVSHARYILSKYFALSFEDEPSQHYQPSEHQESGYQRSGYYESDSKAIY